MKCVYFSSPSKDGKESILVRSSIFNCLQFLKHILLMLSYIPTTSLQSSLQQLAQVHQILACEWYVPQEVFVHEARTSLLTSCRLSCTLL
jgi:hypothetical protein